ncbi:MAG: hypothetical protein V1735_07065 [Nanoarchaeota archaeon]
MKVRKTIQKIVALGTGVAMLGATMAGAFAADLKDYPSPLFIGADGVFNGILVAGANAQPADVLGMTNIMGALQSAAVKEVPVDTGDTTTITVEGDSKKIEQSTNKLELNRTIDETGITSITGSDLDALKDSSFTNSFGTSSVSQTLKLPTTAAVRYRVDTDRDGDAGEIPAPYLIFPSSSVAYQYVVTFTPPIKSDHNTGGYLEDIRDKKLTLMGREYTVQKADHSTTWNLAVTLMAGSRTSTLEEGEEKVITVGDKEYRVKADYIGSSTARFVVNDESTTALSEGETYRLQDGTDMGVKTILAQNLAEAGMGDKVEFYLGADKIELEDAETNDSTNDGVMKVNGETLDNIRIKWTQGQDAGTSSGADVSISSLKVNFTPTDDMFVGVNEKASDRAFENEDQKGQFFANGFDFEFKGLEVGKTEQIKFDNAGTNGFKVKFNNKKSNELTSIDMVGKNGTHGTFLGELSGSTLKRITTADPGIINKTAADGLYYYAMLCDSIEYGDGYIVEYKGTTSSSDLYKIKEIFSGTTYEVPYDTSGTGTLRMDGHDFTVTGVGDDSLGVTITGGCNYIYSELGAKLTFQDSTSATINVTNVTIQSEPTEDSNVRDTVKVVLSLNSDAKVDIYTVSGIESASGTGVWTDGTGIANGDLDKNTGYSGRYGVFAEYDQPSSGQDSVTITYPDNEVTAAVFITSGATTSETTGGGTTTQEVVSIPLSAVKMDNEVSDIFAQNAIIVGGPCGSSAAKDVMGNPEPCTKDFTVGHAKIKLYTHANGKVAMLVAGYSAMDTRRAAAVLTNYKDWATKLVGDEVDVTGTTMSDIQVAAPVVVTEPIV